MAASFGHASESFVDERTRAGVAARVRRGARRLTRPRSLPLLALAAVCVLSLGARAAWLGAPCQQPCRAAVDHRLIFDEAYYVNAARVIAGVHVPAGQNYANAPAGVDPNSEHPQLAKLIIAGSIELFGDGPLAWRLGSLGFGSLAILGMFALVRAGGGGRWIALTAASLMAADNLLLVHGRIGTLDIYALAPMLLGAALYLRGRRVIAGALIGVGACFKVVALYVLLVLVLVEAGGVLASRRSSGGIRARARLGRLTAATLSAAGVFVGLLAILGRIAVPYDASRGTMIGGGPFGHIAHMVSYAAAQTSPRGPRGIASYPWQWLVDIKPITYLNVVPNHPAPGLYALRPAVHFLGMISPPILLLALPALALALRAAWRERSRVDVVGVAWFVGTFVPFALLSAISSRTSYLYYMVMVMPGVYVVVARMLARPRIPRWLAAGWACAVLLALVLMYPLTPLP